MSIYSVLLLVWFGGAVGSALNGTGSSLAGMSFPFWKMLFLVVGWPVALPWYCLTVARRRRQHLPPTQESIDAVERGMLEHFNVEIPADLREQIARETRSLSGLVRTWADEGVHPFAVSGALQTVALELVLAECKRQGVCPEYVEKLAATIFMTEAGRLGRGVR